jgi:heat shock protein HslJ
VDTPWKVTGYNNGRGGVTSVLLGTELTATFGADGRVTGSSGCNTYFVSYELDGQTLTIGQAGMTEMFCAEPEGIMDQEAEYLAALSRATTYTIVGDRLQLRDADGALQVDLLRADTADTE